jgi:hypothetical protein
MLTHYLKSQLSPRVDKQAVILDPCCRSNEFRSQLTKLGHYVTATDLKFDPSYDASRKGYWRKRFPDWVITEPPNNDATVRIAENAISRSRDGVIVYLPVSWLLPNTSEKEKLLTCNYHVITMIGNTDKCFIYFPKGSLYPQPHINYLYQNS